MNYYVSLKNDSIKILILNLTLPFETVTKHLIDFFFYELEIVLWAIDYNVIWYSYTFTEKITVIT
jgi:hypothetical protein